MQLAMEAIALTMNVTGMNAALNPAKNTTQWGHDAGAQLSYAMMAQYPEYFERYIGLEIVDSMLTNFACGSKYQGRNLVAYVNKDNQLGRENFIYFGAPNPSHATWNTLWMYTFATNESLFAGFYANYPDTPACNQHSATQLCMYEDGGWWPNSALGTGLGGVGTGTNLPGEHSGYGAKWVGTFGVWNKPILWMYGSSWDPGEFTGVPPSYSTNPGGISDGRPLDWIFQGSEWKQVVQNTTHGEYIAVPGGHWISLTAAAVVNANADGWLGSQANYQYSDPAYGFKKICKETPTATGGGGAACNSI
jgi:hypothetical protein